MPRVMPTMRAAGVGIPPRAAQPGEGGHEEDALGVGARRGQRADVSAAVVDDAQPVAQPLHGGAGHEDGALEGVRWRRRPTPVHATVVSRPSTGSGHGRARRSSARSCRCRRCSWSCPGAKQAWPNRAACWSPAIPDTGMPAGTRVPGGGRRRTGPPTGRTSGRHDGRHPEQVEQLVGPGQGRGCRRAGCGWRSTARWRARRRRARRSGSTAARCRPCRRPGRGRPSTPPSAEQPLELGGREVGVEHQAGRAAHERRGARPRRARRTGPRCGGPARPGPGGSGSPGAAVPHDRGLALVGDADGGHRLAVEPVDQLGQGRAATAAQMSSASCSTQPGRREVLRELPVGEARRACRRLVDGEAADAGRPRVDGDHHGHRRDTNRPAAHAPGNRRRHGPHGSVASRPCGWRC